jgi:membrane-associated phospholipid phosphatase
VRRLPLLAAPAAIAFAVLAMLVAAGRLTSIDQYAVRELMPGLDLPQEPSPLVYSLVPLADVGGETPLQVAIELFTVPASATVAALVFLLGAGVLRRRGEARLALLAIGALVAANVVELLVKGVLERPALFALDGGHRVHTTGFDDAFPSGHAARALLVAALCAVVWPRLTRPAFAWALLTLPALEVAAFHVPSDILGGAILAVTLLALVAAGAQE